MAERQRELQSSCMALPVGMRFSPTDEELVKHYLMPRVLQQPLPAGIVVDFDIYKSDPWDLPRHQFRYHNQQQQRELYFFTPRHPVASKTNGGLKSRIGGTTEARCRRNAGSGVWHGNSKDNIISNSDGEGIAHTTTLNFEIIEMGKKDNRTKTEWLMHEYRLLPSFPKLEDLVLCKIYEKKNKAQEEKEKPQLKRRRNEEPLSVTVTDSLSFPSGEQAVKSVERMARRMHVEADNQLMADNNDIHAYRAHYTESSSQFMSSLWYSSSQPNLVPREEPETEKRIHKRMRVEDNGSTADNNTIETCGGGEEVEDAEETVAVKQAVEHEQQQGLMTDNIESGSYEVDNTCAVVAVNEEVAVEKRIVQRQAEEPEQQQQCLLTDMINERWKYDPNDWPSFPPPVVKYDTSSIWDEDLRRSLQPFESSHWQFDCSEIPDDLGW